MSEATSANTSYKDKTISLFSTDTLKAAVKTYVAVNSQWAQRTVAYTSSMGSRMARIGRRDSTLNEKFAAMIGDYQDLMQGIVQDYALAGYRFYGRLRDEYVADTAQASTATTTSTANPQQRQMTDDRETSA